MPIKIFKELEQGSDDWHAVRCGLLTASEIKLIITPAKLQYAKNEKSRQHVYELAAQRITGFVEPMYISDDMLRGCVDEITAREIYSENYAPVDEVGFIRNDDHGFYLGYSPDGLVGDDGLIECKSRRQKYQIQTIVDDEVPVDFILQLQAGLLIAGRQWIDFVSYSAGLPMFVKRVYPDKAVHDAILEAAAQMESEIKELEYKFYENSKDMIKTERAEPLDEEIIV